MNTGPVLEWAALATGAAGVVAYGVSLARPAKVLGRSANGLLAASGILTLSAFALLTYYFLASRLDIEYVFLYTRSDYPWYYRLVGVWGAQKGTILMWAAVQAAALLLLQRSAQHHPAPIRRWIVFYVALIQLGFLGLVVHQDTFAATAEFLRVSRPLGNGLNPVLLSPYILAHPPAEFLAYGLTAVVAAGGLAWMTTGDATWTREVRRWTRVTWVVYTLGIGIGALWAYFTLSFGGYWAWDPVEVANLIPWLALTAFLHARTLHERFGTHAWAAALLAVATLWFSLYATLATRSGLWVSVHSFTDPAGTFAKDAALRLINIMQADASIARIVGLMGALGLFTLALALRRMPSTRVALRAAVGGTATTAGILFLLAPLAALGFLLEGAYTVGGGRLGIGLLAFAITAAAAVFLVRRAPVEAPRTGAPTRWDLYSYRTLGFVALVLLVALFVGTLTMDLRGVNGMNREAWDRLAPIGLLALALALLPVPAAGLIRRKTLVGLAAGGVLLGVVGTRLFPTYPSAVLLTPPLVLLLALGLLRIGKTLLGHDLRSRWGAGLVLAFVAAAAAFVQWGSLNPAAGPLGMPLFESFAFQATGLILASAALVGVLAAAARRDRPLALGSAGLAALLIGHGVGLLSGGAAMAVLLTADPPHPRSDGAARSLRARTAIRLPLVQLVHVGLAVGLLGFAWSTYAAQETGDAVIIGMGQATTVGPYTLRYVGNEAEVDASGTFQSATTATLRVERDGQVVGSAHSRMFWVEQVQHYDPATRILHLADRDIYVASLAFCRDPTGVCAKNDDWVEAHENGVERLRPSETVTAIAFQPRIIPLVGLVWSGFFVVIAAGTALAFTGPALDGTIAAPVPRPAVVDRRVRLRALLASEVEDAKRRVIDADGRDGPHMVTGRIAHRPTDAKTAPGATPATVPAPDTTEGTRGPGPAGPEGIRDTIDIERPPGHGTTQVME